MKKFMLTILLLIIGFSKADSWLDIVEMAYQEGYYIDMFSSNPSNELKKRKRELTKTEHKFLSSKLKLNRNVLNEPIFRSGLLSVIQHHLAEEKLFGLVCFTEHTYNLAVAVSIKIYLYGHDHKDIFHLYKKNETVIGSALISASVMPNHHDPCFRIYEYWMWHLS